MRNIKVVCKFIGNESDAEKYPDPKPTPNKEYSEKDFREIWTNCLKKGIKILKDWDLYEQYEDQLD